jgi:hypothetical protein
MISNYLSCIPGWESYCEPLLCRQLSRIFIFTNALLEGMGSDNVDRDAIEDILQQCRLEITDELNSEIIWTEKDRCLRAL